MSRLEATLVSFALCLIYLIFLPFQPWALAVLIGASTLTVTLLGRPEEVIAAGISTAVVMVSAALSPQDAWRLPFLRLADTIIGRRRRHRGRMGRLARAPPQTQEPG